MLYCRYCDYYRILSVHPGSDRMKASICEYTNCIFCREVEELDMEYPCNLIENKRKLPKDACGKITA